MLHIIDNLMKNCIPENDFLISFDVVNMFPSIHLGIWDQKCRALT